MTVVDANGLEVAVTRRAALPAEQPEPARSTLYFIWRGLLADRWALLGAGLVAITVFCALFAPWLAPYGPNESDIGLRLQGIGTEGHILGLDTQGRDVLSRIIYGARVSLITGLVPVLIVGCLAVPLGMVAAYFERVGAVIMRLMDVLFAFPMVLMAILLAAIIGPGQVNMIIALVVVLLPFNTRVVYAEALQQKHAGYVEAARAVATPDRIILFSEMLPHVISTTVIYSTTIVGNIVVTAAGLSFLGLGVQPPTADWGIMASEGRAVLHIAPHIATLPGIAIFILVSGFNLVGDALRDALDPRSRHSGRST